MGSSLRIHKLGSFMRMPSPVPFGASNRLSSIRPRSGARDIAVFCDKTGGLPVMNIRGLLNTSALLVLLAAPAILQRAGAQTPAGGSDPHRALLTTYCVTCHNTRLKTGG